MYNRCRFELVDKIIETHKIYEDSARIFEKLERNFELSSPAGAGRRQLTTIGVLEKALCSSIL